MDAETSDPSDNEVPGTIRAQIDESGVTPLNHPPDEFQETAPAAQSPSVVRTVHVDVAREQERTRAHLAQGLFIILVVVVLALLVGGLAGVPLDTIERLGTLVLSPLLGLFGAATGFYYGGKGH